MNKDFLAIGDFSKQQLTELLTLSQELKRIYISGGSDNCLANKSIAMLFEKPSLRTRMSFEVAMTQLAGHAIYMDGKIGQREPIKDMARVISRYCDGIVARTFSHEAICQLAQFADVPVINALSDYSHPCQAMADVLTIREHCGSLEGKKILYVGDGNNVARSLAFACAKLDMNITIASPKGYELDKESVSKANSLTPGSCKQTNDPKPELALADIIYTDTWVSMGQEDQKQKRIKDFEGFQVNAQMLKLAKPDVKIMHCLPAYRDCEITDDVMESENSIIFDQAENRLHFQRALLKKLISQKT